jgi:superfamily I DNA/RNA helicase
LRLPGRDSDEAEERRLFYVGMTRARERLFLTRAESRHVRGAALEPSSSPFLQEIEARLVETKVSGAKERSNARGKKKQMSLF